MFTGSQESSPLTPRQHEVLTLLSRRQQWSIGEIAAALGVSSPAATKTVVRLESKGFVSRSENVMDRRRASVRLTGAALEIMRFSTSLRGGEEAGGQSQSVFV